MLCPFCGVFWKYLAFDFDGFSGMAAQCKMQIQRFGRADVHPGFIGIDCLPLRFPTLEFED
jgi:hypothetical protein